MHGPPDGDDAIRRAIENLNQEGMTQPVAVAPRPSGWVCPKCGKEADQRIDSAPGTILGYKPVNIHDAANLGDLVPDERPSPVSVFCPEVTARDENGVPVQVYLTIHCLNCFNIWQRRKMMEEIRANVPPLEYRPKKLTAYEEPA